MNYEKYANLEPLLFNQVNQKFHQRGYLTVEEFFLIVTWKSVRARGRIKQRLENQGQLKDVIKKLSMRIYREPNDLEKLRILIRDYKLRLPMASAILTVLYPDQFSIYDKRVRTELGIRDFTDRKDQIDRYFTEFLPKVKYAPGETLRQKDHYLWGRNFYKNLRKFLEEKR